MAKAFADMRLVSSWRAILKKIGIKRQVRGEGTSTAPLSHGHGGIEEMTFLQCNLALLASTLFLSFFIKHSIFALLDGESQT